MATSLRLVHGANKCLRALGNRFFASTTRRYLLSEAYSCNEAWRKHLQDPIIKEVSFDDFASQIVEQLGREDRVSAVDMNVFAHQLHKMDEDDPDYVEGILARFNLCQDSIPHNDSTSHAIVRGFLDAGYDTQMVSFLTDRLTYGIFPNHYTLNLAMDSFIKEKDFQNAAKVAYCSMLQEDFSNPTNTLLCLYSAVQHLLGSNVDDLAPPPKEASEGEEEWVKVNYIREPYYDDHFDIKDERFLLGKTLLRIGDAQSVDLSPNIRNSLKIIGCGIYHKFPKGLAVLKEILNSSDGTISQKAIDYFSECLEKVEARDPNEPEVELALRTLDDVIHRMLPTTEEKEVYIAEFSKLKEELTAAGKVDADFDLEKSVTDFVTVNLPKYEPSDISAQTALFDVWQEERKNELNKQVEEYKKNARIEEMRKEIRELQEREEILTYFDFEENIRLAFTEEDKKVDPNLTVSK